MIFNADMLKSINKRVFKNPDNELTAEVLFDLFINPLLQLSVLNSRYTVTDKKPKNQITIDTVIRGKNPKWAILEIPGFPQYKKLDDEFQIKLTSELIEILNSLGFKTTFKPTCQLVISW